MARTPEMPINSKVLQWARKTLELDVPIAAEKLGIKEELLTDWENGTAKPSYSQLKKIGFVYKRATAVFFLEEPPQDPSKPKDFRVLDEETAKKLDPSTLIEIRSAQRKRLYALELAERLNEGPKPFNWKATISDDAEELGKAWRKRFGITIAAQKFFRSEYDAFNTWKRAIENFDVLVFQASLDSLEEMRGLAVYEIKYPLIMLNTKDSPRGKVFSMLHEFCHLLLQKSGIGNMEPPPNRRDVTSQIEVFCNAFAGACLVSQDDFLSEYEVQNCTIRSPLDQAALKALANRYQVSWEVILRRLLTFGKISQSFYSSKREDFKKFFTKKKDDGGFAEYTTKVLSYNGEPFTRLVISSFEAGNITASDVSSYLGIKLKHLDKMESMVRKEKGT
jgi:Zn-dependent peptidase ImmA (M78 family)